MPFCIVRNDITRMQVDAIVNAANTSLAMGGGVCGAIFKAAGPEQLQAECDKIGGCETGQAVITDGYNLLARYIIHTPGPVWKGGNSGEEELLRNSYINSLKLAKQYDCESIAFPLISSGIYGYPKDKALQVVTAAAKDFLNDNDMDIYLVVLDRSVVEISEELLCKVRAFIDEHYVNVHTIDKNKLFAHEDIPQINGYDFTQRPELVSESTNASLDFLIEHLDESFSDTLMRLIDAKGKTDVEVYKKANIDRRLFSRIRCNKDYRPNKKTVLALAIALELSLNETNDLLERAGFTLSSSQLSDVIVTYFIEKGQYDIYEINNVLFSYSQAMLCV